MRVENLIVEGEFFIAKEFNEESLKLTKSVITKFMNRGGFIQGSIEEELFVDAYMCMNFYLLPRKDTRKKGFFVGFFKKNDEDFLKRLETLRNDLPFKINILISPFKLGETKGILIKIRSEPGIVQKRRQLG